MLSIVFILNLHCFYNHGGNCFIKIALFYKHIFCPHSFPRSPCWSQRYGFDKKRLPTLDGSGAHLCLVTTLQWTLCCCPQNNPTSLDESLPILSLHRRTLLAEMCSELSRPVSLGQKDRRITVLGVTGSVEVEILQNREDKTAGPHPVNPEGPVSRGRGCQRQQSRNWASERIFEKPNQPRGLFHLGFSRPAQ